MIDTSPVLYNVSITFFINLGGKGHGQSSLNFVFTMGKLCCLITALVVRYICCVQDIQGVV